MTLFDLTGKTAIITGATKGIGRAIASRMAEHGANVVVSSRKADMCEEVAQDINENWAQSGGEAAAIACHISHHDQLQALVDKTVERFGGLDILALDVLVGADGSETILELNDTACGLMYDFEQEDCARIRDVLLAKMG